MPSRKPRESVVEGQNQMYRKSQNLELVVVAVAVAVVEAVDRRLQMEN